MTRDELLAFLEQKVRRPIEESSDDIMHAIGNDAARRQAFQLDRLHLDELIGKLQVEEFADIEKRLDQLSKGLQDGVSSMNQTLGKVKKFAKAADAFATIVGLVARIVALA